MANRRAKRTNIWDSVQYSAYMQGTFDARFLEFGLGSFSALCKISNFTIFLLFSSPNFYPIHPNFIQGIIIIQTVTFLAIYQKLWQFEIFLTQDHMQLEFSISPTIFIGVHPNILTTLATMVNACQHIAMRSWRLMHEITYSIKTFQNILVYWVFAKAPGPLVCIYNC